MKGGAIRNRRAVTAYNKFIIRGGKIPSSPLPKRWNKFCPPPIPRGAESCIQMKAPSRLASKEVKRAGQLQIHPRLGGAYACSAADGGRSIHW